MFDNSGKSYLGSNAAPSVIMRLFPVMVVFGVVVGFVALAWYAYHAGTQSVKDSDLLVVEADKTPIKEKPVDAGGMQFPNQDKTIFETFSGSAKQPPKVERVLPTPEEPVAPTDTSETAGWINDKFHKKDAAAPATETAKLEQVIAPAADNTQKEQDVVAAAKKPMVAEVTPPAKPESKEIQMAQATPPQPEDQTGFYVAKPEPVAPAATPMPIQPLPVTTTPATPVPVSPPPVEEKKEPAKKETAAPVQSPFTPAPAVEKKEPAKKETAAPKPKETPKPEKKELAKKESADTESSEDNAEAKGVVKVQLGAYRSEKEAKDAWNVMQKKHDDLLGDMEPTIVKADLGAKGIYYRLRVGEFGSTAEAGAMCGKLVAAGQQCIIPTSK